MTAIIETRDLLPPALVAPASPTVLVVDDDEGIRDLVSFKLQMAAVTVR